MKDWGKQDEHHALITQKRYMTELQYDIGSKPIETDKNRLCEWITLSYVDEP